MTIYILLSVFFLRFQYYKVCLGVYEGGEKGFTELVTEFFLILDENILIKIPL